MCAMRRQSGLTVRYRTMMGDGLEHEVVFSNSPDALRMVHWNGTLRQLHCGLVHVLESARSTMERTTQQQVNAFAVQVTAIHV